MVFEKIENGIFRLLVPFEDLTTTVYLYVCQEGAALIDSATYPADVDQYILPALEKMNISQDDIKFLLLTHHHGDHSGGIFRLAEKFPTAIVGASYAVNLPNVRILEDNQPIIGDLYGICLPGHTKNSFGFFDAASGTLLSGDCLQLDGVGKYRNGIADCDRYIESVNRLRQMNICRIVAAHEYVPLGSIAQGKNAIGTYLDMCIEIAEKKKAR